MAGYESHNLENKNLPIIFHYDVIKRAKARSDGHWHSNVEMLFCTSGCGKVMCNSVEYDIEKGNLVVINSNVRHTTWTTGKVPLEFYCLIIDAGFLMSNGINVEEIEYEYLINSENAKKIYSRIIDEIKTEEEYSIPAIRAEVLNLMVYLSRFHSATGNFEKRTNLADDENIKLALSYIKANLSSKLTLDEVADEVGLSKHYFSRRFKKITGMTFVSFVNALRCRTAKKMLSKNEYSIHEIAVKCGFENDSYFSKTFKSIMGCLPSECIKMPSEEDDIHRVNNT